LTALFFFLRVPYWIIHAVLRRKERSLSIEKAGTYLIGGFNCLWDWKELLMNKDAIKQDF